MLHPKFVINNNAIIGFSDEWAFSWAIRKLRNARLFHLEINFCFQVEELAKSKLSISFKSMTEQRNSPHAIFHVKIQNTIKI